MSIEIKNKRNTVIFTHKGASLRGADLRDADLRDADLRDADLYGADLRDADLYGADLYGANLQNTKYIITQILLANWYDVSDNLCCNLMRLDAEAIPDGQKRMNNWVNGGKCPLIGHNYNRIVNFTEKRRCWKAGRPKSLWNIWKQLAKEKNVKI